MALKQRHRVGWNTRGDMAYSLKRNTSVFETGAPNENIVQNHLNIALLNVF